MIAADLYEGIRPAQLGDQAEVGAGCWALLQLSCFDPWWMGTWNRGQWRLLYSGLGYFGTP